MKKTPQQFRDWNNKSITLLGMSGVGKTTLSSLLPASCWFHYSGDYRIGTRYLDEAILDQVKSIAMQHPFLRKQLCNDSIYIRNNITIDHLNPISDFLGKVGNPEVGGLSVAEFKRRQALFRQAEIGAMQDVGEFMTRSRDLYGYPHFLNDAGGSICGLGDEECWNHLSEKTLVLYLKADEEMKETLLERARQYPKPLNYEDGFLDQHMHEYKAFTGATDESEIIPDDFVQWIFPRLFNWRLPQYQDIADRFGHTADASKIFELRDEQDFIDFVCEAIEQSGCSY